MSAVRILDLDCNLIAEIDNYENLTFQRKLYRAGTFTLALNVNVNNASELQKNRLIIIDNNPEKVGIIKEINYSQQGDIEKLTVKGYELKGIFQQRITIPSPADSHQRWTSFTAIETIMKELVQYQCLDISGMEFDNLNITTDTESGTLLRFETRYKNLADELEKIGRVSEIGYEVSINFATKKWDFDIINGIDRTSGTESENPVLFALEYDNIESQVYVDSDIGISNYCVVAGQGSGSSRTIVETGSTLLDVEKYVAFADARDINTIDELTDRGKLKIAEATNVVCFDCIVYENRTFIYETDYFLGDIVTIQNKKLGISIDKRIEEITEYYQTGGRKIQMLFGNTQKSLKKYIDTKNEIGID